MTKNINIMKSISNALKAPMNKVIKLITKNNTSEKAPTSVPTKVTINPVMVGKITPGISN